MTEIPSEAILKEKLTLKHYVKDLLFLATTFLAYYTIPSGYSQIRLIKLVEIMHTHPELEAELAPIRSYLFGLNHSNIAPYFFIAVLSLFYAFSARTIKITKVATILLTVIFVVFNFVVQRLS